MNRFHFIKAKKGAWDCVKTNDGAWCLYEEHLVTLAEKDAEIARLRKSLEEGMINIEDMDWTTDPPTRPGWYWWRDEFHPPQVQHVVLYAYADTESPQLFCSFGFVDRMGGEWWSERIKEPQS